MINLKGIGSPRARDYHQRVLTRTLVNMYKETVQQGLDILCEALVTKNPYDNYPDIIIKDETGCPVFIMEITRSWGLSYDRRKCISLKQRFPGCKFYIFNYETDVLYCLTDDYTWLSSREYEFMSPLFERPVIDYIYMIDVQ